MDLSQLSKFKKSIEGSKKIALIPSLQTKGEALLSSLALLFSLDNFNRKTSLLLASLPPSVVTVNSAKGWQDKPVIIINNPSGDKISQLRYEKNHGRVYLWFDSHGVPLREEDVSISFPSLRDSPDLFICLGFSSLAEIDHPIFRQKNGDSPVINIDNHPRNELFGQINLIDSQSSLTEMVANIIKDINEDLIDRKVGAYLLKGLKLYATHNNFSDRSCQWIARLVNQEALTYNPNPCTSENIDQLALLEKSIKDIVYYPHNNSAILVLPYYSYSQIEPSDLIFLIEEIRSRLLELNNLIILWQPTSKTIQGIVYFEEDDKLNRVAQLYPGEYQKNRGVFNLNQSELFQVKENLINCFSSF